MHIITMSLIACTKDVQKNKKPPVDYGTLTIDDAYAWIGYPKSKFFPVFSDEAHKEELTYEYNEEAITIDVQNNTVTALKKGIFNVVAKSEHFETTFKVRVEEVDTKDAKFSAANFAAAAENRKNQWTKKGVDGKTTIFIGDSFFDTGFWSDFYTTHYSDKDALCLGIAATTTYDWEEWIGGWLGETAPKNIVMHVGTNNVYDDKDNTHEALSAYQRMFTLMHEKFPTTHIYWFGVSQRAYDESKIKCVSDINAAMQKWCDQFDFITYIDTPSELTNDMLKDTVHPKLEYYSVFVNALAKTDIVIENSSGSSVVAPNDKIEDIAFKASQTIASQTGLTNVSYKGKNLAKDYILTGKLDITQKNTNSHIQFGIINSGNDRILLWDNESAGKFKLCIPYDTNVPTEDIYTLESGATLTIEWKIVYHNNNVYFFIADELKLVYAGISDSQNSPLTLGSENTECRFYDMKAITLADDAAEYQTSVEALKSITDAYKGITSYQRLRA